MFRRRIKEISCQHSSDLGAEQGAGHGSRDYGAHSDIKKDEIKFTLQLFLYQFLAIFSKLIHSAINFGNFYRGNCEGSVGEQGTGGIKCQMALRAGRGRMKSWMHT